VAQGVGPEFKLQHHRKEGRKEWCHYGQLLQVSRAHWVESEGQGLEFKLQYCKTPKQNKNKKNATKAKQ
jgi:hypothetical protein